MKLGPLIKYPGGQSKEARRLAKFFPPHDTYVEPFVGGGSFFFYKQPARREVIGDTSDWVIDFYQKARMGGLRACRGGLHVSQVAFSRAAKSKSACSRMLRQASSFAGSGRKYNAKATSGRKFIYKKKFSKLDKYEKRLRKAWLTTRSFDKTMKKFDGPDTWHLLDPPWPGVSTTQNYDGKLTVSPESVAKTCRSMEGTVWVLYNDTPQIRKAFSDFHQYRIKTTVMGGSTGGGREYYKLLITNKPITGKPEGTKQLQDIDSLGNGLGSSLGMSSGAVHFLGSVAAVSAMVAIRKASNGNDRSGKQLVGDIVVGSSTFWLLAQIATSAFDGLAGR